MRASRLCISGAAGEAGPPLADGVGRNSERARSRFAAPPGPSAVWGCVVRLQAQETCFSHVGRAAGWCKLGLCGMIEGQWY
jgi:hypothetical protein